MSLEWSKQLECSVYLILFLIKGGKNPAIDVWF